jgi:3-oxoacyl-[acyl-carrier-protein] synthase II
LADGAAFLVLARDGVVANTHAYLTGVGLVADAENDAGMSAEAVIRAMDQAISMREAGRPRIDLVIVHGTGTQTNDQVESEAIASYFRESIPLVTSYKGVLGHPQGASGAVGVALAVECLRRQTVFGTWCGVDPTLALSGHIVQYPQLAELHNILVLSHGTWGVYSAIVVSDENGVKP